MTWSATYGHNHHNNYGKNILLVLGIQIILMTFWQDSYEALHMFLQSNQEENV